MSETTEREIPTYLIQVQKQTAMTGEIVTISTNMPKGTTEDELKAEVSKITSAIDHRMEEVNKHILKATKGRRSIHDYDIAMNTGIPVEEVSGDNKDFN